MPEEKRADLGRKHARIGIGRARDCATTKKGTTRMSRPLYSWGPWCKEDLNRLMPWIDKIWALHPYFPELISKKRTLQSAELL